MKRKFPQYVVRLGCLAAVIHVCCSWFMAVVVEQAFPHRMLDTRAVAPDDHSDRMELTAAFFDAARRDGRPLIGFFGSSFTYGYPFPPSATFTTETQARFPDRHVINVSMLASGLDGIHFYIELAALQNCRFETLVLEMPIVNETAYMVSAPAHDSRKNYADARASLAAFQGSTHFQWFLRRPGSSRHLANVFDELMLPDKELRLALGQPYDGYFATRDKFEAVRDKYEEKVALTLRAAQKISDRVVAFSTPIYLAGEDRIRYDVESLREQIDATYAACESVGGVVAVRFDERFLQDDTLFSNLTHLNLHGNREFGAWMAGELGEGTAGPPAALASQPEVGATRR